ncbi:MAG: glycosyltransferase, partial [Chloroflexota bacterium]|nr:glycosyltransferase [Chloroflexota bacterium]
MKLLFIAPSVYPVRPDLRYGGIEKLCYMAATAIAQKGHRVSVAAPDGSYLLHGVEHIPTGPTGDFVESERQALVRYRHRLREFDAILDYSHSHWSMMEQDLPSIAFIWHDPFIMKPQEPPYNIAALSSWQAARFAAVYGYDARVLDPHCAPVGAIRPRTDRFLTIGRLTPSKGPLEAVAICRELGVPLDVVGALGQGDDPLYQAAVVAAASEGIRYHGEVDEGQKMELLETCRALLYPIAYPPGQGEAHSHKTVDAQCAGAPVVTYDVGALSEVVEHGVTGFLAKHREEFKTYMGRVGELHPDVIREKAAARWSVEATADRLLEVAQRVAKGERWGAFPALVVTPVPTIAPSVVGFIR